MLKRRSKHPYLEFALGGRMLRLHREIAMRSHGPAQHDRSEAEWAQLWVKTDKE